MRFMDGMAMSIKDDRRLAETARDKGINTFLAYTFNPIHLLSYIKLAEAAKKLLDYDDCEFNVDYFRLLKEAVMEVEAGNDGI